MKKIVLFITAFIAVALSACSQSNNNKQNPN